MESTKILKILILEDNQDDAEIIKYELKKSPLKFEIKCVTTEQNFLDSLMNFQPDIILADYTLVGFDGLSALKLTKKISPETPFIFVSGSLGEEKAVEMLKEGAIDYVLKDRLSRLVPAIERALNEAAERSKRKQVEQDLAMSYEKLKRILEETAMALSVAMEKRDPYTGGHQMRVTSLACAIAKELGYPEDHIENIRIAGLLHDIGKIAVPAEILIKPGRLTETEFNIVKTHPSVGYEILREIEFDEPVADYVLQHHERLNGSGYPNGLTGDKILPAARILGVADVVEAMSSHRPYRPALGIDVALAEIEMNSGILYDQEVVSTCVRLFTEKKFAFK